MKRIYYVTIFPLFLLMLLSGCAGGGVIVSSRTYVAGTQTVTYSNGSTVTNTATSTAVVWASDHITSTTTYSFADGTTNAVVATVAGTAGTPSYSGSTQTIVTTYGDATTSTATNAAVSNVIIWASDHVTRTTTYTYADGGSNAVVATVAGTTSTPVLTASVYSSDWTTTGVVTAPSTSSVTITYGDGTVTTTQAGTTALPFDQTTLSAQSITDPSAVVASTTTTYNLTWGTPDKSGPGYALNFPNASNTLSSAPGYAGITVAGQTTTGPTLLQPSADVLAAWNSGWTGKGINILLSDSYANRSGCTSLNGNCHGVMTMMNANLSAPGATLFGLDYAFVTNFTGTAFDGNGTNLTSSKSINVINMSWGFIYSANNWNCNNGACVAPTDIVYNNGITSTATTHVNLINVLNGVTSVTNLSNFSNTVVVKSAGNDGLDTKYDLTVLALSGNSNVQSRLLIVGALDKNGTVASTASKASYTNYAGTNTVISDRFVMANGEMPWTTGSVKINGSYFGVMQGTSFAAPLVAGYAAVLMSKFPNLNAINTSNIILDTARTDTLSCTPDCSSAIYGKGEASLSRALAPVGRLR